LIQLNANGKTLVSVGSWEEIYTRPGFVESIDVQASKLVEILGRYSLQPKQPCGITSCRQPHNRGYIVDIGEGREGIIGNVCGKTHFGVDFQRVKNAFNVAVNATRFRENIITAQHRVPSWLEQLERLRKGEKQADYCYAKIQNQMLKYFDERTSRALTRKAKAGDGRVLRAIELSADEREAGLGERRDAQYRTELVFTVAGIKAATDYAKLSPRRLETFEAEIAALRELDAESLSYNELKARNRQISTIEEKLADLEATLLDCQRFIVPTNIAAINANKSDLQRS